MAGSKKISIKLLYGLIAAGSMILFIIATRLAGPKEFIGDIAYLGYAILIGLAATAAMAQKKANGGWLGFQDAVKTCFSVFVFGLGAHTLFTWLLLNFIDPHFKQQLLPEIAVKTEAVYRRFGVPEDQIDQAMEAGKKEDPFTLGRMLMGLALYYIVHFFIALLIAAVVKRKKDPAVDPGT